MFCPICGNRMRENTYTYYDLDTGLKKIERGDKYRIVEYNCDKCGYSTYIKEKVE